MSAAKLALLYAVGIVLIFGGILLGQLLGPNVGAPALVGLLFGIVWLIAQGLYQWGKAVGRGSDER